MQYSELYPEELLNYDSLANTGIQYRELFDHDQMLNRSDGVVDKVFIAGKLTWNGKDYETDFGTQAYGRLLKPIASQDAKAVMETGAEEAAIA